MIDKTHLIENWQFCDGSHFQDGISEINVPDGWTLNYADNEPIPVAEPPIEGLRPECVPVYIGDVGGEGGKFGQSPPNPGQYNRVLKIHKWSAPFAFDLLQTISGLEVAKRYLVRAWAFPDFYNDDGNPPEDAYAAAFGIGLDGSVDWQWPLEMDTWLTFEREFVTDAESIDLSLSGLAKWGLPGNTFWLHGARLYLLEDDEEPITPPDEIHYFLHVEGLLELGDNVRGLRDEIARLRDVLAGVAPVPPEPGPEPESWRLPVGTDEHPPADWYTSTRHGPNSNYRSGFHTGIDVNADWGGRGDADRGQPIFSIAPGVVHSVGYQGGKGWLQSVVIRHEHAGAPLYVRYAHLREEYLVRPGDEVEAGDLLGHLGDYQGGDTGDHLHFDMCTRPIGWAAWCSAPLEDWLDPVPVLKAHIDDELVDAMLDAGDNEPPPSPPSGPVLLGLNDEEHAGSTGTDWMMANALQGLIVRPVYIGMAPHTLDYSAAAAAGLRVIVNLRYSWSTDYGGQGTLPTPDSLAWHEFIDAAQNTILRSHGVWGWTVANEANNPREHPKDGELFPDDVRTAYVEIRDGCGDVQDLRMAPGALDPYNAERGDPRDWLANIYQGIPAEFVAFHGYIRGPNPGLVGDSTRFQNEPLTWQALNYPGCITALAEALPSHYQSLDVYVTEFNHIWKDGGEGDWGWVNDERAAEIVRHAHRAAKDAAFTGLALYRWAGDAWALHDNEPVKTALIGI